MRTIATISINNILKQYKEQYYKTINKTICTISTISYNNMLKQYKQYKQYQTIIKTMTTMD